MATKHRVTENVGVAKKTSLRATLSSDFESEGRDAPLRLVWLGIGFRGDKRLSLKVRGSGLVGLFLRNQTADALGEESAIEWFLESVVEPEGESFLARLVTGQCEQDRALMIGAFAEILRDLTSFDAAQGHIDNDAIRVKALSADTRFKT